jgi:pimeloyl-[acyl-carrier protein] methyl ester esterase
MSFHVRVQGQGQDLVLLHGWAMHGGVFDELLPSLTTQYRVHCIDLPGHGQSRYHGEMNSLQQLAAAVLPHVPENAIVLGWSLGGQVALQLAQQMPLRALMLVSTTPRFVAGDNWQSGMPEETFAQFFARLHENHGRTVQDFLNLQVRGDAHAAVTLSSLKHSLLQYPAVTEALYDGLNILRDTDLRSILASIKKPALVISGEYDRITHPDAGEYLAHTLPFAQFALCRRAGHAPFISHRDWFMEQLQQFVRAYPLT